jgi:uncharacterized protein YecE (DUF72 family)
MDFKNIPMRIPEPKKTVFQPLEIPPDVGNQGFYVGTSGYYYDDWMGLFNPPKIPMQKLRGLSPEEQKDHDRLLFYQKYFPLVEINHTFYREPVIQSFTDIDARSAPRTLYIIKVYKDISHTKTFDTPKSIECMKKHVSAVEVLRQNGRFYSFLIQLEDHVLRSQKKLDYLLAVSSGAVKSGLDVHIEFRHGSWHTEHVLQSLKDSGIGICNTEIPPFEHVFPLKSYATSAKGYIRYSGRNLENWYPKNKNESPRDRLASRNARYNYLYSDQEVNERVKGQIALRKKVEKVAVVYNNHYQIKAVLNAIYNIRLIRQMALAE